MIRHCDHRMKYYQMPYHYWMRDHRMQRLILVRQEPPVLVRHRPAIDPDYMPRRYPGSGRRFHTARCYCY
jgi:hypothetical protein